MREHAVKRYFRDLPFKARRGVARAVAQAADRLRALEEAAAPVGETGKTKASVRVRRTKSDLTLIVEAGGPSTTKPVRRGTSVTYDYALAGEFGTERQPAKPWFYPTYSANREEIQAQMMEDIGRAIEGAA